MCLCQCVTVCLCVRTGSQHGPRANVPHLLGDEHTDETCVTVPASMYHSVPVSVCLLEPVSMCHSVPVCADRVTTWTTC